MDINRCKGCGKYTLRTTCPGCSDKAVNPRPGPFSPEDRHGKHRRKEKLKRRE